MALALTLASTVCAVLCLALVDDRSEAPCLALLLLAVNGVPAARRADRPGA